MRTSFLGSCFALAMLAGCGDDDAPGSGGVACGGATCSAGQVCCIGCDGRGSCQPSGGSCPGLACVDTGAPVPDSGAPAVDMGPGFDSGTVDSGPPTADSGARDSGPGCNGSTCGAGEMCCPLDCEGTRGCAASCPDLVCPTCEGMIRGVCGGGLACQCCPAGGPTEACLCSTPCSSDADCTDPERPTCNLPTLGAGGGAGFCTPRDFRCCWGCNCAAPDTPIATPSGERPIAQLAVGDLVYSVQDGAVVVVPIVRVQRVPVPASHRVMRVELANGRTLQLSPGHPSADGRLVGDLHEGDVLDGTVIRRIRSEPYRHDATYDILPGSASGDYYAAGVLVGSTI